MRTLCVSALTVICYSVCLAGTKTDDIDVSAAQKAYRKGDVITGTVARPSKKDAGTTYVLSAGVGDEDFTIVTDSETGVNTFGFALETTGLDAGVLTLLALDSDGHTAKGHPKKRLLIDLVDMTINLDRTLATFNDTFPGAGGQVLLDLFGHAAPEKGDMIVTAEIIGPEVFAPDGTKQENFKVKKRDFKREVEVPLVDEFLNRLTHTLRVRASYTKSGITIDRVETFDIE